MVKPWKINDIVIFGLVMSLLIFLLLYSSLIIVLRLEGIQKYSQVGNRILEFTSHTHVHCLVQAIVVFYDDERVPFCDKYIILSTSYDMNGREQFS